MRLLGVALCLIVMASPAFAQEAAKPVSKPEKTAVIKSAAKPSREARKEFEGAYVGDLVDYKTKYEDTLVKLARDYDVGFVELRAANPDVDPWLPGANVRMVIPTRHLVPDAPRRGVVINLPEMRLYFYDDKGSPPATYPIGIGREGLKTPVGRTTVRGKNEYPTWRPTARMRAEDPTLPVSVPPGPDNPLGTHVLYLNWPEYGIHGTNKPYGIGRRSSSGCIRMYPEDILKLFPVVDEGEMVTVVDQSVKAAWIDDKLYIEAHPTMDQAGKIENQGGFPAYDMSENDMKQIIKAAGDHATALNWIEIRKVIRERRGYPIAVATRPSVAEQKQDEKKSRGEKSDAPQPVLDSEASETSPS